MFAFSSTSMPNQKRRSQCNMISAHDLLSIIYDMSIENIWMMLVQSKLKQVRSVSKRNDTKSMVVAKDNNNNN